MNLEYQGPVVEREFFGHAIFGQAIFAEGFDVHVYEYTKDGRW